MKHHLAASAALFGPIDAEEGGQTALGPNFQRQNRHSSASGHAGHGCADHRLADPAFPGHDDYPRLTAELARIQTIRRLLLTLVLSGLLSVGAPVVRPVHAQTRSDQNPSRVIDIIKVGGRIDPVSVDFIDRSLKRAEADDDEVMVIQLDSEGSLLGERAMTALTSRLSRSTVPVAVWVGPTGAVAYGGAARLVQAAALSGMATKSRIGRSPAIGASLTASQAVDRGVVGFASSTIGEFVVGLNGRNAGGRALVTSREIGKPGRPGVTAAARIRFSQLGFFDGLLHTAASPQLAFLLLILGMFLVVFEFFTAGVGVAGVVGAGFLVLSAYGLAVLPTSTVALALLVVAVLGFSIDVQAGSPRAWTAIGSVCLLAGSWRLYGDGLAVPWLTVVVVVAGFAALMISGMPSMLRARFSTPTVGRESMIGTMGQASTGIDPEGTVTLAGGQWRARTNRATPIAAGAAVRVVAIDGLLLEVEPDEGGARDAGH